MIYIQKEGKDWVIRSTRNFDWNGGHYASKSDAEYRKKEIKRIVDEKKRGRSGPCGLDAGLEGMLDGADHETLRRAKQKVDEASTILKLAMQKSR